MDRETRNRIQRATQDARALLEREYAEQLTGTFDIRLHGTVSATPGGHLDAAQRLVRTKIVTAVEHLRAAGHGEDAVGAYIREIAFTTLNRFVALKMLEARGLVQECLSRGEESIGFKEFVVLAPGLVQLPDHGFQLYIESVFDEIGREVRVLFDRRDPNNLLWPRRQRLLDLLALLNNAELASVWAEDETIGWVYQYFNSHEERRQMRGESQVPRNSRELAVRNQFFTPKYVVQFLTDNTLGRIWHEMRRGDTKLRGLDYLVRCPNEVFLGEGEAAPANEDGEDEDLSPPERFRRPVYVPFRAKKDPREIRVLDPACGSGHFLLYAFDLLLVIYEEAWADEAAPKSEVTGRTLRGDYPQVESLRAATSSLILRHNLHGIDIDTRCAQIAALALWMRAQRAFKDLGIAPDARPTIQKTNIVVAEPMPGDPELRREFGDAIDPNLRELMERVFDRMELAGEAGPLLRIEEDTRDAVRKILGEHGEVFRASDEERWRRAEKDVLWALRIYAERAANGRAYQRRLFAEDAAQGLGLIDLCNQHYDAVLMNPPFGSVPSNVAALLEAQYPNEKNDVYAAFVARANELLAEDGFVGAITSNTGLTLGHLESFRRRHLLGVHRVALLVDLGPSVLDGATVKTAMYVVASERHWLADLLVRDVTREKEKAAALTSPDLDRGWKLIPLTAFLELPGTPLAYNILGCFLSLFASHKTLVRLGVDVCVGMMTGDDFRFLRAWWEVDGRQSGVWSDYEKGNGYARFAADPVVVVKSHHDFEEVGADVERKYGSAGRFIMNKSRFGEPGLVYTRITNKGFSVRYMPPGLVFSGAGLAVFPENRINGDALLAYLNSRPVEQLLRCLTDGRKWEAGYVRHTPIPDLSDTDIAKLARAARAGAAVSLLRLRMDETARVYAGHGPLDGAERAVVQARTAYEDALSEVDTTVRRTLGLTAEENAQVDEEAGTVGVWIARERNEFSYSAESALAAYVSWTVGVALGRFDVRLATGDRQSPKEPEPFGFLPPSSPGMLTGCDGLPAEQVPPGYAIDFPRDGILVDDTGHERDLIARVRQVFEVVLGDNADARWREAAEILQSRGHGLRGWFASSFFEAHVKRYSKSRRKAPVYWQLGTPSARYSVWLYYHRFTRDTLYRVLNDYVTPKLKHEERKLINLVQDADPTPSATQRKEIDAQERFVDELRTLRDEVARVAPLWNPDLNDGVIINFAPLWRLVPQNRSWQKECVGVWDKLVGGDCDWAHLAMHLWPARVLPKCAKDRSLAIAHGLQEVFWEEDPKGKWKPKKMARKVIDRLVGERTSAAAKAAVDDLLRVRAATAIVSGKRGGSPRRSAATRTR